MYFRLLLEYLNQKNEFDVIGIGTRIVRVRSTLYADHLTTVTPPPWPFISNVENANFKLIESNRGKWIEDVEVSRIK